MPILYPSLPPLWALALAALAVCPSCSGQSVPRPPSSRTAVEATRRPPGYAASPSRRLPAGRPDPRYRPSAGFPELRTVAGEVARASGRKISWDLRLGPNPGSLVRINGSVDDCTIYVHPIAARKVPPNTWAFLFGHEFAHFTESLGSHSETNPGNELKADIVGARYAMAAGYRIEAFLGWVLTEPDQKTASHGSLHRRVHAIAAHFGVPEAVLQEEGRRAWRYRSTR